MDFEITTVIIIAITAIVSFQGFSDQNLFNRYKFNPVAVTNAKQYDRLISSGFLHADSTHLIFNMLTFYFFAPNIVYILGLVPMVIIYLGAILGGNLLALFMHKGESYYNAIGASGGVSGILFTAIAFQPKMMLGIMFVIPMPAWIFAIGYLAYSIYGMKKQLGNIGHDAHLGGAIVGLGAAIFLSNGTILLGENQFYVIGMIATIVVLGVLMFKKR